MLALAGALVGCAAAQQRAEEPTAERVPEMQGGS